MKYFELSIGIAHDVWGNEFRSGEITEEKYNKLKQRFIGVSEYRFSEASVDDSFTITWDFQSNYNTGYVTGIATEENYEQIKQEMYDKVYSFIKRNIEYKKEKLLKLNHEIFVLEQHPIYDAITKALMREEKINQILNQ